MKVLIPFVLALLSFNNASAGERLIACGHQDYPPFMWRDGDNIEGVGFDIASKLFSELNIEVDATFVGNWRRCLKELELGKVDLVVAAYVTNEREKYARFTETPLSPDPSSVFVWKGREFSFEQWNDLKGKKMGSLLGDSLGSEFDDFISKYLTDLDVKSREQLYRLLEVGRVDFLPSGHYAGLLQIRKYGYQDRVVPLEKPLIKTHLHMALSKKSKYLKYLPYLDQRLQELTASGEVERLINETIDRYIEAQTAEPNSEG